MVIFDGVKSGENGVVSGFYRSGYRSDFGDFWVISNFLSQCMDGTDSLVFAAEHLF